MGQASGGRVRGHSPPVRELRSCLSSDGMSVGWDPLFPISRSGPGGEERVGLRWGLGPAPPCSVDLPGPRRPGTAVFWGLPRDTEGTGGLRKRKSKRAHLGRASRTLRAVPVTRGEGSRPRSLPGAASTPFRAQVGPGHLGLLTPAGATPGSGGMASRRRRCPLQRPRRREVRGTDRPASTQCEPGRPPRRPPAGQPQPHPAPESPRRESGVGVWCGRRHGATEVYTPRQGRPRGPPSLPPPTSESPHSPPAPVPKLDPCSTPFHPTADYPRLPPRPHDSTFPRKTLV